MSSESLDQARTAWTWLARIRRVQGRKGEVLADLLTDFPEKFKERKRVWLLKAAGDVLDAKTAPREIGLANAWVHKGDIVLHFAGIDSINDAESLRGLVVAVPQAERTPLGEDEVYIADLIGCQLVDVGAESERIVGTIEDVDRDAGPVALLVLKAAANGAEVLVPFAKAYLRRIDVEAKRVEMALPEGLVEVQLSDS
jgi:16S rRNA processing protein RimM